MNPAFAIAMTIGFFSTVHCIGMCGGIISALNFGLSPAIQQRWEQRILYNLAYNLGRVLSYTAAGALLGTVGQATFVQISPDSGHVWLQALSAGILALMGLYLAGGLPQLAYLEAMGVPIWRRLQPLRQKLLPVTGLPQALALGLVWGGLPCGLVYSMLLASSLQGSPSAGAWYMLGFGLGTLLPLLLTGLFAGQLLAITRRPLVRKIIGAGLMGFALVLLWGLDWQGHFSGQSCHIPGQAQP